MVDREVGYKIPKIEEVGLRTISADGAWMMMSLTGMNLDGVRNTRGCEHMGANTDGRKPFT